MAKAKSQLRQPGKRRWWPTAAAALLAALLTLTLLLLMLLGIGTLSLPLGDDYHPFSFGRKLGESGDMNSEGDAPGKIGEQWTEILSWEPRVFLYHNFLSKEESEYLIELARPLMVKSTVVASATGKSTESRIRTSKGMFFRKGANEVVRNIEKRIADFTFIPVEHGEGLQVLHYEVGQKYDPHHDYFLDEFNIKRASQRMATVLMYLSDVEEGGETVFPYATGNVSAVPWWNELSECGKKGLAVKPKMGDALLFWSMKPDASLDPYSLHGGCPVIRGNKWLCTKWLHVDEFKL